MSHNDSTAGTIADALTGFSAGVRGDLPQLQAQQAEQKRQLSDERRRALLEDNRSSLQFVRAGDIGSAVELLQNRAADIDRLGGDPSDTLGQLNLLQSELQDQTGSGGFLEQFLLEGNVLDDRAVDRGFLPALDKPEQDKFIGIEGGKAVFSTPEGEVVSKAIRGLTPGDLKATKKVQSAEFLPGGLVQVIFKDGTVEIREPTFKDVKTIKDAEERGVSLAQAKAEKTAAATVTGRSGAGRTQLTIDEGRDAVQGIPLLRRSLTLLERIETGGVDAAKLRAKQLFGVEGADEGELSANLGRAVLSQLKTTFGSAFTEAEGARLERLNAGFGKSVKTNKRLLRQTLTLSLAAADRAIAAAKRSGDTATEQELLDFVEGVFDLSDEDLSSVFNPDGATTQPQPTATAQQPAPLISPAGATDAQGFTIGGGGQQTTGNVSQMSDEELRRLAGF